MQKLSEVVKICHTFTVMFLWTTVRIIFGKLFDCARVVFLFFYLLIKIVLSMIESTTASSSHANCSVCSCSNGTEEESSWCHKYRPMLQQIRRKHSIMTRIGTYDRSNAARRRAGKRTVFRYWMLESRHRQLTRSRSKVSILRRSAVNGNFTSCSCIQ